MWALALWRFVGCASEDADALDGTDGADTPSTAARACAGDLAVELGAGESSFEPLEPGQVVPMVHGPQGGWHVETAGLVTGSTGQVSVLPSVAFADTGERIAGDQQPQYLALVGYRDAECDGTYYGVRAYLDDLLADLDTGMTPMEVICSFAGRRVTISADVGDLSTGEETSASIEAVLELDPRDVDACAAL